MRGWFPHIICLSKYCPPSLCVCFFNGLSCSKKEKRNPKPLIVLQTSIRRKKKRISLMSFCCESIPPSFSPLFWTLFCSHEIESIRILGWFKGILTKQWEPFESSRQMFFFCHNTTWVGWVGWRVERGGEVKESGGCTSSDPSSPPLLSLLPPFSLPPSSLHIHQDCFCCAALLQVACTHCGVWVFSVAIFIIISFPLQGSSTSSEDSLFFVFFFKYSSIQ